MDPTPWSATLETGHPALDEQHLELFRLHLEALDGVRGGDGRSPRTVLAELLDRTREHFAFEEKLMAEAAYPQRELHARTHSEFMADLVALVSEGTREPSATVVRLWLESRYASWWKWHVRSTDAPMAKHLRAAGTRSPG